ncbi:MAG TPA: phage tail protein [Nocardioidaceae bacterium]
MRGAIDGLVSPHPIGETLPSMYQGDPFTRDVCDALDDVLAPTLCTLDNLAAYLDLSTAPEDLLPWLAGWIGMSLDRGQQPERQRELLRAAGRLQGWQGTARGIELAIEAVLGMRTEVLESGGAIWSLDPNDPVPGEPVPSIVVRVFVGDEHQHAPDVGQQVDEGRLNAVIEAIKPVHVRHRLQVVTTTQPDQPDT